MINYFFRWLSCFLHIFLDDSLFGSKQRFLNNNLVMHMYIHLANMDEFGWSTSIIASIDEFGWNMFHLFSSTMSCNHQTFRFQSCVWCCYVPIELQMILWRFWLPCHCWALGGELHSSKVFFFNYCIQMHDELGLIY